MSEEELNIKYIQENTGLVENDELIPIILNMIKGAYKSGLVQAEIDNTMGVIEENSRLKQERDKYKNIVKEYERLNKEEGRGFIITDVKEYDINDLLKYKNIVEELEKWIYATLTNEEFCYLAVNYKDRCRYDVYNEVLNKLQELKGGSDERN